MAVLPAAKSILAHNWMTYITWNIVDILYVYNQGFHNHVFPVLASLSKYAMEYSCLFHPKGIQ